MRYLLAIPALLLLSLGSPAHAQWEAYHEGDVDGGGRLFVHGDSAIAQAYGNDITVTADDGQTWMRVDPGWSGSAQFRSAFHFGDHFYILGTSGSNSFLRATGDLQTWEVVPGLEYRSDHHHSVSEIATDGEVLWIRTWPYLVDDVTYDYGSYLTSTDGENWTLVAHAPNYGGYTFHDGRLYATAGTTLMVSSDYGATWEEVTMLEDSVYRLVSAGGHLYAELRDTEDTYALHVSSDGGATWTLLRELAGQAQLQAFGGDRLAVYETGRRTWIVRNGGQTWTEIPAFDTYFSAGFVADGYLYLSKVGFGGVIMRAPLDALGIDAEETGALAEEILLHPASPNPFATTTTLLFDLPRSEHLDVRVYDLLGREVAVLASGIQRAGERQITFDATGLPSGLYLVRLATNTQAITRRVHVGR